MNWTKFFRLRFVFFCYFFWSLGRIFFNFNKNIFSKNIKSDQIITLAKEVSIEFLENNNSFSDQEWKELYKLSEETFVEETDSLKAKGAGAGLTDND